MELNQEKNSVLIVDDNPENIDVLIGSLRNEGYHLRAANRGKEALRIVFQTTPPDLVLLDIMMPDMNGFEVCQKIKEDPRTSRIPVIFVTARISEKDETRGFSLGAVDYIHKPISPMVVQMRVATHLALANQNRELEHRVADAVKEIEDTRREIIRRLGVAGEFRDNETASHVMRVGSFVEIMSRKYGVPESDSTLLKEAAQMHDVGKIGIPDRILLKPGIFTPDERKIMERHCEIGAKILGDHPSLVMKMARRIALSHHEKWNGQGYPTGLSGKDIPYEARLTAIADVFDALISKRPYKDPWPIDRALGSIKEDTGKSFDPEMSRIFSESIEEIIEVVSMYPEETTLSP